MVEAVSTVVSTLVSQFFVYLFKDKLSVFAKPLETFADHNVPFLLIP